MLLCFLHPASRRCSYAPSERTPLPFLPYPVVEPSLFLLCTNSPLASTQFLQFPEFSMVSLCSAFGHAYRLEFWDWFMQGYIKFIIYFFYSWCLNISRFTQFIYSLALLHFKGFRSLFVLSVFRSLLRYIMLLISSPSTEEYFTSYSFFCTRRIFFNMFHNFSILAAPSPPR